MIAVLRARFGLLFEKVDAVMRTHVHHRRGGVDLRGDYHLFLRKYTAHIFVIFSQLIVAKSTNQAAIQSLGQGCDLIEKLFPLVTNIEVAAPYFARSVCGIVFSSMEALMVDCKRMGGKVGQSSDFAFLAVREFLFNVRRKIAEAEREAMFQKTGIGILYVVIARNKKMMGEQVSIRKRK